MRSPRLVLHANEAAARGSAVQTPGPGLAPHSSTQSARGPRVRAFGDIHPFPPPHALPRLRPRAVERRDPRRRGEVAVRALRPRLPRSSRPTPRRPCALAGTAPRSTTEQLGGLSIPRGPSSPRPPRPAEGLGEGVHSLLLGDEAALTSRLNADAAGTVFVDVPDVATAG